MVLCDPTHTYPNLWGKRSGLSRVEPANPRKPKVLYGATMAIVPAFSPARLLATFFGCGYSPVAPGTVGSAAAIALAIAAERWVSFPPWSFAIAAVAIAGPAIWSAGATAREAGVEDPSMVVIDEVVGQWIS